jgi:hypothetical protein
MIYLYTAPHGVNSVTCNRDSKSETIPASAVATLAEIANRPGIFKGRFLGRHVQLVNDGAESIRQRRGVFRLYCLSGREVDR